MKKVLIVLGVLGVIVGGVVVAAYMKSPDYTVERSVVIAADDGTVFPYLNELKKWPEWTVWTKENIPELEQEYSGPESGVGAKTEWTTKDGTGSMVITKSDPDTGVDYTFQWEGFPQADCNLKMAEAKDGTQVTWVMAGSMPGNPLFRVMGLFINMEETLGAQFDESLEKLKKVVEEKKS